ncbi:hypothetical protein RI129_007063 [Pyrocoelia pectoralis]|uniref:Neuroendocrine protein 7B2 n=1 Tax=Pyrocoelia pectoralis TaxID=417401 RepID=A0AAN7VDD6_9COLE
MKTFIFLFGFVIGTKCYVPQGKDSLLTDMFLQEVMNRMDKDLTDSIYLGFRDNRMAMGPRSIGKDVEEEQFFPLDYDGLGENNLHPSLRDQEFLQQNSLWGNQFVSGGAGEGIQRLKPEGTFKNKQEIKTDATLPAYCTPPNPCPLGYTAEHGCLESFENTASFSRRYQAAQDCMCDSEHMFDCPNPADSSPEDDTFDALNDLEFNRFLQRTMQVDPSLQHKNLVAKKFTEKKSYNGNPFLAGERLPVAAKKGTKVYV